MASPRSGTRRSTRRPSPRSWRPPTAAPRWRSAHWRAMERGRRPPWSSAGCSICTAAGAAPGPAGAGPSSRWPPRERWPPPRPWPFIACRKPMSCAEATAGPDLHFQEGAQPPMEGRGAPRHQAGFEDLEQLLSRCAEADRALHVRHETGPIRPAEGEERDGDELADFRRDVLALSQAQLVDPVEGLDELRVLPGRELPLGIDVRSEERRVGKEGRYR